MFIPADAVIAREKLTHYLLVPRPWDDKSAFLARAGFSQDNPDDLLRLIRSLAEEVEAMQDGTNAYGVFWRIDAAKTMDNGYLLQISLIWLQWHMDGTFHFVTLKPWKQRP
ncbi:MAG TPA: hypothetical protein VHZ24_00175 [Pirellulales bacterium]|jgi:hypothetical protein|nr:hypothetical protein [Pirellulales bacterium]